jgi:hypothetical protein
MCGIIERLSLGAGMQGGVETWYYDPTGKKVSSNTVACEQEAMERSFDVGDLVRIVPVTECPASPAAVGDYGVILGLKEPTGSPAKNVWRVMCVSKWLFCYEVAVEGAALLPTSEVPPDLEILSAYSEHLKGKRLLPECFVEALWAQKIYPLNDGMRSLGSLLEENPEFSL